jgi:hypothetical protein
MEKLENMTMSSLANFQLQYLNLWLSRWKTFVEIIDWLFEKLQRIMEYLCVCHSFIGRFRNVLGVSIICVKTFDWWSPNLVQRANDDRMFRKMTLPVLRHGFILILVWCILLRLLSIRKTKHLCSHLYSLYYPHFTTCFGLHRPSSGIAYTKVKKNCCMQY